MVTGTITARDLERFSESVTADATVDPSWPVLVDARETTSAAVATETIVSRASRPRPQRTRVAIVAGTDAVYGVARMFQILAEGKGGEIGVFRSLGDAETWLGIPSSPA